MELQPSHRRKYVLAAVGICLLNLGFFKYANFFIENISHVLGLAGFATSTPVLSIILPVGISFYTFQSLAYTIDVYRGEAKPCRDLINFALFVSFFPQLVAGPIERSRNLLPQVENKRSISPERIIQGLTLLVWGFFKKLVIADTMGLIVFKVFNLAEPGFYLLWAGVFAFGIQILADFWSYTDIARGSSLLLGFKLSRNFDHPYFSTSPADFWRRWHMTFSSWLRDYVFIPLGGSRVRATRYTFNIMATFLISGLWHGASWNFVLWGAYHGLLVLLHRVWRWICVRLEWSVPPQFRIPVLLGKIMVTLMLVNIGWLLFRETDFARLVDFLQLIPWKTSLEDIQVARYIFSLTFIYSLPIIIHGLIYFTDRYCRGLQKDYSKRLLMLRPVVASLLFIGILTLRSPEPATFIYFQF